jgi:type VI secretion system secreted protein VgrG
MARTFELTTPLVDKDGKPLLLFRAMQAREELGRLPELGISALSSQAEIDPREILGKKVTVKMELKGGGPPREFNGHVTRFGQGGTVGRLHEYQLTLRPWLWFLTRTADCRIFQRKTAPEIVKEVLTDKEYRSISAFADGDPLAALTEKSKYPEREYCVQYRETDFNFVSRLLEEEGIYYFFVHQNGEAQLKLVDSLAGHKTLAQTPTISYFPPHTQTRAEEEYIRSWSFAQQIQPGFVAIDDYDLKNPKANLLVTTGVVEDHEQAIFEIYDYPGEYRNPDTVTLEKILEQGEHYASARVNELHAEFDRAEAECNVRGASVGGLFTLKNAVRQDQEREYLIVAASYQLLDNAYETSAIEQAGYDCRMTLMPSLQTFRPARVTPEPRMDGPQTAVVVTHRDPGTNKDDDITCDEFGRVKVRFHWDREHKGKNDENASCFIRVAQPWAGAKWGAIFLPRVGQEVLVDFLEGDPDQPIIIGSVYNADQMPPYDLPANKTQSGIKTRSTKEGTPANFNEIQFEDKKGHEQINIHAEKDFNISVEHNMSTTVDHDDSQTVKNNRSITVQGTHNETITKDTNITISKGPYRLDVQNNTYTHHVNKAVTEWYDATQETHVWNDILIQSGNAKITVNAKTEVYLKCGTSFISIKDGSITLSASKIEILGGDTVKAGVSNQNVVLDRQKVATSGAAINSSAVGMHEISGALVKIN